MLTWNEYAALGAPGCATLVMNGDADKVIDREDDGSAWESQRRLARGVGEVYAALGAGGKFDVWFEAGGGHRPYFAHKRALEWIHAHLGTPAMALDEIRALPTVNAGEWCDRNGIALEQLYGNDLHQRGATLADPGIRPAPSAALKCLQTDELGAPEFTIEGWLEAIEGERR